MTESQLKRKLAGLGLPVKPNTLRTWARKLLIMKPKDGNWSEWSFAEALATGFLLRQGRNWRDLVFARVIVDLDLERDLDPTRPFCLTDQGVQLKEGTRSRGLTFEWLITVLKARIGIPLAKPVTINVNVRADGTCWYTASPPVKVMTDGIGPKVEQRIRTFGPEVGEEMRRHLQPPVA